MSKFDEKEKALGEMPGFNQGKKPEPHDPGNPIYDEQDVIAMVYDVAPVIYKRKSKWFFNTNYDLDDFVQDAALHILEKFREDYLDLTNPKLKSVIYTLLNGYFILNKSRWKLRHDRGEMHLDADSDNSIDKEQYKDLLLTKDLDPEEMYILEKAVEDGEKLVQQVINQLSSEPFQTRKHRYRGSYEGEKLNFSEQSLIKLFLQGLTLKEIQDIYNSSLETNYSKARMVERKLKNTLDQFANLVNQLDDDKRFNIKVFIINMGSIKNALPDDFLDDNRKSVKGDGGPDYYDTI